MVRNSKSVSVPSLKSLEKATRPIFTNRFVLYVLAFIAITNLLGYLALADYGSVVFFILAGVLSTYYTKNMSITLLVAILGTNIVYRGLRQMGVFRRLEGFDNKKNEKKKKTKSKEDEDDEDDDDEDGPQFDGMTTKSGKKNGSNDSNDEEEDDDDQDDSPRINRNKTLEEAYDNLNKMVGSKGMNGMAKETKRLADQQKNLMKNMESMKPMMDSVLGTVEKFGGVDKLMEMGNKLGGTLSGSNPAPVK